MITSIGQRNGSLFQADGNPMDLGASLRVAYQALNYLIQSVQRLGMLAVVAPVVGLNHAGIFLFQASLYGLDRAKILDKLRKEGLLDEEKYARVTAHAQPSTLIRSVIVLENLHLLTQENVTRLVQYPYPQVIAEALEGLKDCTLTKEHIDALMQHHHPIELAVAFRSLIRSCIDDKTNREMVMGHLKIKELSHVLRILHESKILSQENFNECMQRYELFSESSMYGFWTNFFDQENFHITDTIFKKVCSLCDYGYPNYCVPEDAIEQYGVQIRRQRVRRLMEM